MARMDRSTTAKALTLISLGVVIDQVTKHWAQGRLPGRPIEVIPKALSFVYVENRNAAFGLGSGIPDSVKVWILLGLTSLLTIALTVAMFRSHDLWTRAGYGIVVAGAIGNIIDRVRLGYVVDFIFWHGGFTWPNFNVADMLVCTGVGILLVFGGREQRRAKEAAASAPSSAS